MKKIIFLPFLGLVFSVSAQTSIVKFAAIEKILKKDGGIQILNFWATWCAPCVKELPILENVNGKNLSGVNVTLINLDFAEKVEVVNAFIKKKNLKTRVLLLDEIDYNSWIDQVDPTWSGAIPATLILNSNNGKRKFIEGELHDGDIEKFVQEVQ
jgi:thiol-disulfide isomerase/thioredoxin